MLLTKHALLAMQRPAIHARPAEMSEGRRTQIVLLDDRRLDIIVQPRLFVSELLNIVASHCHLKDPDKQYFGLSFYDEKQQCHWLQNDRRVLDHEFPRKFLITGATLVLRHQVKFYVESITQLAHSASVELMFLQTRMQLQKGFLQADHNVVFQLGAYAMQIYFGDFTNVNTAKLNLKRLALMPSKFPSQEVTPTECEDRVIELYENLCGMSKGTALVNYMSCVERLHTYGVHAYEVKDKAGATSVLGISSRGIYQYEPDNMDKPKKGFHWKQLENLYYRERKFSIEVHDPKRVVHTLSSFNVYEEMIQESADQYDDLVEAVCDPSTHVSVSRRAFIPSNIYVHVFWCETAQLCKTIWSLAIAQHQFYLDKRAAAKQKGTQFVFHTPRELAEKLDQGLAIIGTTVASMSSAMRTGIEGGTTSSDLGSSVSSHSVHSIPSTCSAERSEDDKQREAELYKRLRQRKRELEEMLLQKIKELKDVCIREGEITGELPAEIRRALIPGEAEPKIKRRVGTAFAITSETMSKHTKADQIAKLEADVEIHRKIVAAALKLASDSTTNKSVRRKRRRDYDSARQRLRELEQRLHQLRLSSSKPDLPNAHLDGGISTCTISESGAFRICKSLPNTPRGSIPDLTDLLDSSGGGDRLTALPSDPSRVPQQLERPMVNRGLQHSTSFPAGGVSRSSGFISSVKQHQGNGSVVRNGEQGTKPEISNGYRSQSTYQSGYGRLPYQRNPWPGGSVTAAVNRRAESNHSLQSSSSTGSTAQMDHDSTGPLMRSSQRPGEHDIGAYNIPNQRTSWDYECLKQMNADAAANAILGSSESLNIGLHQNADPSKRRPFPSITSTMAPTCYTGSLDRRVMKQRQRDKWKPSAMDEAKPTRPSYVVIPPTSPPVIEPLDRSPTRYGPPPTYPGRNLGAPNDVAASAISPRLVHKLLQSKGSDVGYRRPTDSTRAHEATDMAKYGHIPQRQGVQRSLSHSSTPPLYGSRTTKIKQQNGDGREELVWIGDNQETGL